MRTIEQIAPEVRRIVQAAVTSLGADLGGCSPVDLVLDNLTDVVSSADAKVALVAAGVDAIVSARVQRAYSATVTR